jgi:adenylate cyclase
MRSGSRLTHLREYLYPAIAPLAGLLLLPLALGIGLFDHLENMSVDWRFKLRAPHDPAADPRLILVAIDQASLDDYKGWPWDRSRHADLCRLLALSNPAVIAFDILFTEDRDPAMDADLGVGMSKPRAVISGAMLNYEKDSHPEQAWGKTHPLTHVDGAISQLLGADSAFFPIQPVRDSSLFAFVNVESTTSDGIRRKVPMVVRVGNDVFPTLTLQSLCQYWNLTPDQVHVRLGHAVELQTSEGPKSIPIDEHGLLLLNYRNKDSFKTLSYSKLCAALAAHYLKGDAMPDRYPSLEGKILIVGQTQVGLTDLAPSPLEATSPLVMVHLNALNSILRGDYLTVVAPDAWSVILVWLGLSWVTLFYLRKKEPLYSVFVPAIIIGAYWLLAAGAFAAWNFQLPLIWTSVFFGLVHSGAAVQRWLEEMRSKQEIKSVFASYIAPSVLNQLLAHPENIKLGGVRKPVTILFSDIRGFTTLSEEMGEEELVRQLNEYFEKMVDCVNQYRGTHHKYIGDAVMAVWGDVLPETPEHDAANAVRSALAMRRELVLLNRFWAADGRQQLKIGIGLNHGTVLVGNIGATQRREFTVIGDAVNLASRLEGVTKEYKTDLAIGETVHALVRNEFLTRTIGLIQVKGKTKPVRVYDVLDDLKHPERAWSPDWVARYEEAFELYLAKKFAEARPLFETCLSERKNDYCSARYAEACLEFLQEPPPEDWDGTEVMKTK